MTTTKTHFSGIELLQFYNEVDKEGAKITAKIVVNVLVGLLSTINCKAKGFSTWVNL